VFFVLLTHTGLRVSEAIGLTWRHLHLGTRSRELVREQFYGASDTGSSRAPAFTLRTYVHLMDDGLGDADFLDAPACSDLTQVDSGSTQGPETAANDGESGGLLRLFRAENGYHR
jgi:hypothetical protein